MPIYHYQCLDCGGLEQRVAGLDDHTAVCDGCVGLMLRLDEDAFRACFQEQSEARPAVPAASQPAILQIVGPLFR